MNTIIVIIEFIDSYTFSEKSSIDLAFWIDKFYLGVAWIKFFRRKFQDCSTNKKK